MKEKIQIAVRKYYDLIKLVILLFIATITVIAIFQQLEDSRRQTEALSDSTVSIVEEVKDNTQQIISNAERNTLILCTLIIRGNVSLNDQEITEIENICNQEINRANLSAEESERVGQGSQVEPPRQFPNQSSQSSSSPNNNPPNSSTQPDNSQTPEPEQEDSPTLTQSLVDTLNNTTECLSERWLLGCL